MDANILKSDIWIKAPEFEGFLLLRGKYGRGKYGLDVSI